MENPKNVICGTNSMNILSLAVGHNASATLMIDGDVIYHIEEERLSRVKRDGNPIMAMLKAKDYVDNVDKLVITGTHRIDSTPWNMGNWYAELLIKSGVGVEDIWDLSDIHHDCHAWTTFYNSGFDEAMVIIVDGAGSVDDNGRYETESIYKMDYNEATRVMDRRISNDPNSPEYGPNTVKMYEAVTQLCGWHPIEAGKTMGLSAYGKATGDKYDMVAADRRGKDDVFKANYPAGAEVIPDWAAGKADVARKVQKVTEQNMLHMVAYALQIEPECKNICIGGGYGLNILANAELLRNFPQVKFWFEPMCGDNGNSIGAAKHMAKLAGFGVKGMVDYFLGIEYEVDHSKLDTVFAGYDIERGVKASTVAEYIAKGEIVAIVRGRSEAGPRALMNRSFLFDVRDVRNKIKMNKFKGREAWRPLACVVLKEDVKEWFEELVEESEYMMVAFTATEKAMVEIPAVVHEDNTVRIQTVDDAIVREYKKLTGIGVIGNTSYNLAGEPLVETMEDARVTFDGSGISYLYMADYDAIITNKGVNNG